MSASVASNRFGQALGVDFDLQGALQVRRDLGALASRLPWLQERAIQTLRRRLPVEARRDIQAEYNLTATRIRNNLTARMINSGSTRATGVRLVGQFNRGIGLVNFAARQTRKGVTYAVRRGQRQLMPGSFLASMMMGRWSIIGGNIQAVSRVGAKRVMTEGAYKGKMRQPLAVEYRATVAQMLGQGRRPERLLDYSRRVVQQDVERQLASYIRNPAGTDAPTT